MVAGAAAAGAMSSTRKQHFSRGSHPTAVTYKRGETIEEYHEKHGAVWPFPDSRTAEDNDGQIDDFILNPENYTKENA